MVATLVQTLAAVKALVDPLAPATLKKVLAGPQDQNYQFPTAEIRFGSGQVGREIDARILERRQVRTGVVRIWVALQQPMPGEYAKFAPLVDAIEALFKADPRLGGLADRFDATGNTPVLLDESTNMFYLDIGWAATVAEPDTFVQDW